jgi:hypothetical protein
MLRGKNRGDNNDGAVGVINANVLALFVHLEPSMAQVACGAANVSHRKYQPGFHVRPRVEFPTCRQSGRGVR